MRAKGISLIAMSDQRLCLWTLHNPKLYNRYSPTKPRYTAHRCIRSHPGYAIFYVDEDGFGARKLRALFLDNILGSANAEQLKLEHFGSYEKE